MILEELIIENFQSIAKATVLLKDRGLSSIEGVNLDGMGADSNGSGKSTLINAILWCNYGDAGKKLKSVDHVVNKKAGKDCAVICIWYDEQTDKRYSVGRYRKHKTYKNSVVIRDETGVDLSKGTDRESQLVINEILGADQGTFEAACLARQDDAPDIPGMTDTKLKELLENVLPFEDISAEYQQACKERDAIAKTVADLEKDISDNRVKWEMSRAEYYRTRERLDSWDTDQEDMLYEIENDICQLNDEIETLQLSIKPQDKIDAAIEKYSKLVQSFDHALSGKIIHEYEEASRNLRKATTELRDIDHLVTCDKCGQGIGDKESLLRELTRIRDGAERAYREAKLKFNENELAKAQMSENNNKLIQLQQLDRKNKSIAPQIARLEARRDALEHDKTVTKPNPHIEALERLAKETERYEELSFIIDSNLMTEKHNLEIAKATAETLSPKGLRYHFLETVTPNLNNSTNKYLKILTDGTLTAKWSTVAKLKSGEYKEAFSIEVLGDNINGYGSLSGGEKRKVKLACFFALQDLIASRATKDIKLWCGDEIDHALDSSGLERLMSLLHEKVASKGTILVISHNELRSWIPNYTKVVKENGDSIITGYLNEP